VKIATCETLKIKVEYGLVIYSSSANDDEINEVKQNIMFDIDKLCLKRKELTTYSQPIQDMVDRIKSLL